MRRLQTTDFLSIGQEDRLSHITWSHEVKQPPQSLMATLQDPLPNTGFRLMCRDALPGSPLHLGFQVVQGGLQGIMITIGTGFRHAFHHTAPLGLGAYQRV
jgi:hypothetical protein